MAVDEAKIAEVLTRDVMFFWASKKEEYQKFFKEKLKKYNVKSPAELGDKKDDFFEEIDREWTGEKEED